MDNKGAEKLIYILLFVAGCMFGYLARYIRFDNNLNVTQYCEKEMAKELENYIVQINKAIKKCRGFKVNVRHIDTHYAEVLEMVFNKQGYKTSLVDSYYSHSREKDLIIEWDMKLGGDNNRHLSED